MDRSWSWLISPSFSTDPVVLKRKLTISLFRLWGIQEYHGLEIDCAKLEWNDVAKSLFSIWGQCWLCTLHWVDLWSRTLTKIIDTYTYIYVYYHCYYYYCYYYSTLMICISTQISIVYMTYCTKNHFVWSHEKFHQESMQLRGLQRVVLEVHWKRQILPKGNDMKVRYFFPFLRFQIFSMHQLLKGILVDRQNSLRKVLNTLRCLTWEPEQSPPFFLGLNWGILGGEKITLHMKEERIVIAEWLVSCDVFFL